LFSVGWIFGLAALLAAAYAVWWWLFRFAVPQVNGRVQVTGLKEPVEIVRDRWGVPHIFARSAEDLFFAQGYVHAQDRLWQMELNRRIGHGRLAEIFGPVAVDADRFLRRLGLSRTAREEAAVLGEEERLALESYARGVNAALAAMGGRLPLELRLLGIRPEPWQPADSLAWAKVMALNLCLNWDQELLRWRLARELSPETAARVSLTYPAAQRLIVPAPEQAGADPAGELLRLYEAARPYLGLGAAGASNNWVAAGGRTESGRPLLANDPHLGLALPSVWYHVHLSAGEIDVTGVSMPAGPGVVIGHNRHVGWGLTNSGADVADLYIEKWDPEAKACEYEGRPEPVTTVEERIRVRGKPDVTERVWLTRHGPLMAGGPLGEGPALALRWAALQPSSIYGALLKLNRAGGAAELREALRLWTAPSQNFVFADTEGNIGYVMAGLVPKRRKGTGLTPVPGWSGEYEWDGWVPFEELPQAWNPPSGLIVTANNAAVDHTYRHHITWDWLPDYRARRIEHLLSERERLTPDDFRRVQLDLYSAPVHEFAGHFRRLQAGDPLTERALRALQEWDGRMSPETVGGAVAQVALHAALRRAYEPLLGAELFQRWMGAGWNPVLAPVSINAARNVYVLLRELLRRDPDFLRAKAGEDAAADPWDSLLLESLRDGVEQLRRELGDDPSGWHWGRLHRLTMRHALGGVRPLHLLFNGPTVALGGDIHTPCATGWVPTQPFAAGAWAPSVRVIFDFADLSRSRSSYPGGQSGHPKHRHYLDLFPLWHAGDFYPVLLNREEIEREAEARLLLEPGR
jgi:penicillin G amidase